MGYEILHWMPSAEVSLRLRKALLSRSALVPLETQRCDFQSEIFGSYRKPVFTLCRCNVELNGVFYVSTSPRGEKRK